MTVCPREQFDQAKEFADAPACRIAYDDRGDPRLDTAFLCLPGWCDDRGVFSRLADRLAVTHRVLMLDWRGHGASDRPDDDFGHAELRADAQAVIDASDVRAVIPIAQAHGGWVALDLCRAQPERVPAIVAMSWLVLDPPPPFVATLSALQDPERWHEARERLFAMWTDGAPAEIAARVRTEMGAYDVLMWCRAARAIAADYDRYANPLAAAAALRSPPRMLHLFSQPRAPEYLAAQESFAREHPWFEVHRLDAISHFPALECPQATADAILRFIARPRP